MRSSIEQGVSFGGGGPVGSPAPPDTSALFTEKWFAGWQVDNWINNPDNPTLHYLHTGLQVTFAGSITNGIEGIGGMYAIRQSTTTTNSTFGFYSGGSSNHCRLRQLPMFKAYVRTGAVITGVRYLFGWGQPTFANDTFNSAGAVNDCGIRFSTSAGDLGFVGVVRDPRGGGNGTTQVSPMFAPIAANTEYVIAVQVKSMTLVAFTVINLATNTKYTTTLAPVFDPASSGGLMNNEMIFGGATLDTTIKSLGMTRMQFNYANSYAVTL